MKTCQTEIETIDEWNGSIVGGGFSGHVWSVTIKWIGETNACCETLVKPSTTKDILSWEIRIFKMNSD